MIIMPQKATMGRDARSLLIKLNTIADGCTTLLVTYNDIWICDQICIKYYVNPVIKVLQTKLKGNKNSNSYSPKYVLKIIESMFRYDNNVCRNVGFQINTDTEMSDKFKLMSEYMITDYSTKSAESIVDICMTNGVTPIKNAINSAVQGKIYNENYIKAILEREQALSNIKKQEMQRRQDAIDKYVSITDDKVKNTPIELAMARYNWEKAMENAELEALFKSEYGDI